MKDTFEDFFGYDEEETNAKEKEMLFYKHPEDRYFEGKFKLSDLNGLESRVFREGKFLWDGFKCGSVGALVAQGGTGKTFFALQAAIAVACDDDAADTLGIKPQTHGRVVYLSFEDDNEELEKRVQIILKDFKSSLREKVYKNLKLVSCVGSLVNIEDRWDYLQILQGIENAEFVVFDTFACIHSREENSNSDMAQIIGLLKQLANNSGAAILYLHHITKTQAAKKTGVEKNVAARGASVLTNNIRYVSFLEELNSSEKENLSTEVEIKKRCSIKATEKIVKFGVSKSNYAKIDNAEMIYGWSETGRLKRKKLYPIPRQK